MLYKRLSSSLLTKRVLLPPKPTFPHKTPFNKPSNRAFRTAATMSQNQVPLPILPVSDEHKDLVKSVNTFVHGYMSSAGHDSSHDYQHILRVVSNAKRILERETERDPDTTYNVLALFLAALLHGTFRFS